MCSSPGLTAPYCWGGGPAGVSSFLWIVQLECRLDATAGDHPSRLMFKAVSPDRGNMVAYVELDDIDHSSGTAMVELPLVAPHAADRDLLGGLLLRKLAERAFGELRLRRLSVRFDDREGELAGCCWWAWPRSTITWTSPRETAPASAISAWWNRGR